MDEKIMTEIKEDAVIRMIPTTPDSSILTDDQKAEILLKCETGGTTVPITGDRVPENCNQGFGTWSPVKAECTLCPHVPMCFSRATNTHPRIIQITKRSAKAASVPKITAPVAAGDTSVKERSPRAPSNRANPFRQGTAKYAVREVILSMAKQGLSEPTDDMLYNEAANMGFAMKAGEKPTFKDIIWEYDPELWPEKRASEAAKPIHGMVTFKLSGGQKPVPHGNTYLINVEGLLKFLEDNK